MDSLVKEPTNPRRVMAFHSITKLLETDMGAAIPMGDVHLYGVSLTVEEMECRDIAAWLSAEEQARAARLISNGHRQQFVAAHGAMRLILSRYCETRPEDLAFASTALGKPFLRDTGTGGEALQFNLTHSQGRALIAVARGPDLGVDLETLRPKADVVRLATRFFSSRDQEYILSGGPLETDERFLRVWVAKEAVSKARGSGMTFPLNREHVEIDSEGVHGRLIGTDPAMKPMVFRFVPLEKPWVGAVAAKGDNWRVVPCT